MKRIWAIHSAVSTAQAERYCAMVDFYTYLGRGLKVESYTQALKHLEGQSILAAEPQKSDGKKRMTGTFANDVLVTIS